MNNAATLRDDAWSSIFNSVQREEDTVKSNSADDTNPSVAQLDHATPVQLNVDPKTVEVNVSATDTHELSGNVEYLALSVTRAETRNEDKEEQQVQDDHVTLYGEK